MFVIEIWVSALGNVYFFVDSDIRFNTKLIPLSLNLSVSEVAIYHTGK